MIFFFLFCRSSSPLPGSSLFHIYVSGPLRKDFSVLKGSFSRSSLFSFLSDQTPPPLLVCPLLLISAAGSWPVTLSFFSLHAIYLNSQFIWSLSVSYTEFLGPVFRLSSAHSFVSASPFSLRHPQLQGPSASFMGLYNGQRCSEMISSDGNLTNLKCQKYDKDSVNLVSILNLQAVRELWVWQKCALQICKNVLWKMMTVEMKVAHFLVANHHTSLFISLLLLLFPGWEYSICVFFRLDHKWAWN